MTVCRICFHEAVTESLYKQQRTDGLLQLPKDILAMIGQWVATGDKLEAGKHAVRWGRVCILTHQLSHRLAVAIATTRSHCSAEASVTSHARTSTLNDLLEQMLFNNRVKWHACVNELFFKDDTRGLYMMAEDLCRISMLRTRDYPLSLYYYKKAAKLGHTKAAYELTMFFLKGNAEMGIIRNFRKARKYAQIGITKNAQGCIVKDTGSCNQKDFYDQLVNLKAVIGTIERIEERKGQTPNDAKSLYGMAQDLYWRSTNYPLALHYYKEAAKLGHTKAAYELTHFFLKGNAEMGIIQNFQKARKYVQMGITKNAQGCIVEDTGSCNQKDFYDQLIILERVIGTLREGLQPENTLTQRAQRFREDLLSGEIR